MQAILKIGDMTIKYQYHFNDYLKSSIDRYQTSEKTYDWTLSVELTETYQPYDLDFKVINKRYHYIDEAMEVVTVYHDIDNDLYSQQLVFDKHKKEAFIRLNPKYVKDLAMQEYVLSGIVFLEMAVMHGFVSLHASAINYQQEAILFSAPSTTGKSTQAKLWQKFDSSVEIINDDKPLLFKKDNRFYVIGSPFSGKTQENLNKSFPVKCILFLKQSNTNALIKLSHNDLVKKFLINTMKPKNKNAYHHLLSTINDFIHEIPIYEFNATKDMNAVTFIHEKLDKELSK